MSPVAVEMRSMFNARTVRRPAGVVVVEALWRLESTIIVVVVAEASSSAATPASDGVDIATAASVVVVVILSAG